ncbi:MAG: SO2930 family diheme c-type cytochrome [Hyphomonadaceae bacterium]
MFKFGAMWMQRFLKLRQSILRHIPFPSIAAGGAMLAALVLITNATAQAPAGVNAAAIAAERPPALLSAYRFFRDAGARTPNTGVTPYDLNTALYSDGALKFRFVYVPPGQQAQYRDEGVFEFPLGTVLIKTFAFAADMRRPSENVRFLETRLLIRRAEGWFAYPYVWNAAQTEARLSPIGANVPVTFVNEQGEATSLDWAVPNQNQCKGCHDLAGELAPIGPSARNLNVPEYFIVAGGQPREGGAGEPIEPMNQLDGWSDHGLLAGAPPASEAPRVPHAYDRASGSLEARARAYLDVNCAHCHNPQGPAHTSGLDLRWRQHEPISWGVGKRPVAAGRGSAGFEFSIEPGHPERSILLYRMRSTDPGVMMPELGRQLVDERGAALIEQWIAAMDEDGRVRD